MIYMNSIYNIALLLNRHKKIVFYLKDAYYIYNYPCYFVISKCSSYGVCELAEFYDISLMYMVVGTIKLGAIGYEYIKKSMEKPLPDDTTFVVISKNTFDDDDIEDDYEILDLD